MKAKPLMITETGYEPCEATKATHVMLNTPGPFPTRIIPVGKTGWIWNGDTEKPTLKPSILTTANFGEKREKKVCHSFVTDGRIQFLGDCTHQFAGQTVELLEVE